MNRILILLASLLVVGTPISASACAYGAFGSAETFLPSDVSEYKLLCNYGDCGLALDDSGAWGAGCGLSEGNAKASSIRECQRHSSKPATCKVVDVNQQSGFLKGGKTQVASTPPQNRPLVGNSRLESQFPRVAHLFGDVLFNYYTRREREIFARIDLIDGRLVFSMWGNTERKGKSIANCDAKGELATDVTKLSQARLLNFDFSCGGEHRRTHNSNWGLRLLKGNIDRIEMKGDRKIEGAFGEGPFVFLNPKEYAEYLKDREERERGEELFGTDEWLEKKGGTRPANPSEGSEGRRLYGTGTGFLVNENFIATADHVLRMGGRGDVCNAVSIMYRHDEYEASIADLDPANDIGLIKLSEPISTTATIRGKPDLRLGETAINYGFPLTGELSSSAKITSGAVNSLAGYNNNSAFIQFDAASQFGNSGGPVLDASGNVIGVVSAKLDDAENQLVNFATKSTILEGFLKANKVPYEKADLGEKLELPDIAEKAETFTVLVGCWE